MKPPETDTVSRDVGDDFENSAPADPAGRSARTARLAPYRWRRGESGCPGGGAGAFSQRVRQAVRDGEDLIQFLVTVMHNPREKTSDRLAAVRELANRGWGKPPEFLAVKRVEDAGNRQSWLPMIEQLKPEDQQELLRLLNLLTGDRPLALPDAREP